MRKSKLPNLGLGLGLRKEIFDETLELKELIHWCEIISENYMEVGGLASRRLSEAMRSYPVVCHGVNLSIGGAQPISDSYLRFLSALVERTKSPWFSDHLCFTRATGRYLHDLYPLPRNLSTAKYIAKRVRKVQTIVGVPFLLENISYYVQMPGSNMSDAEFLSEICDRADCGILLDVNNVVVNSKNFGLDPEDFFSNIDFERVVQLHVAGHKLIKGKAIDTHAERIDEMVFSHLEDVLHRCSPRAVLLERDDNFEDFHEVKGELQRISQIMANTTGKHRGRQNAIG